MADNRDLAIDRCDNAFKEGIGKITQVLVDCLATAHNDDDKKKCRERYKKGMQLCKEAHEINREVVDELFPKKAGK